MLLLLFRILQKRLAHIFGLGWVGNTLGVWGVGVLAAKLRKSGKSYISSFLGTAVLTTLGIILILLTPATGIAQLLYPLLGALIGYYVGGYLRK